MSLKELFVALKGGVALYHRKFRESSTPESESQLISGFVTAMSNFASEVFGESMKEIHFSKSKLVVQEIEKIYIICVTGLELPLQHIINLQQSLSISILKIVNNYEDPIANLPEIKSKIDKYILESQINRKFDIETQSKSLNYPQKRYERAVFIGLAKAGKSSIVESFFNRADIQSIEKILPTMGMKTFPTSIPFTDRVSPIQIIDLGGQAQFIESHLRSESLFLNAMNLFLIIDTKSKELTESIGYFRKILDIISNKSNKLPVVSIFLHKVDPDEPPSVPSEMYWELTQTLFPTLSTLGINWAVYQTSIYNQKSLDTSIVESFLRALPEDYISQTLLLKDFSDIFDSALTDLAKSGLNSNTEINETKKTKVFSTAVLLGKSLGQNIKEKWVNYIIGDIPDQIDETQRQTSVFANIQRIGQDLKFSLIWPLPGELAESPYFPTIFSGILTGILSYCGSYRVERDCQEILPRQFHCDFWGRRV